MSVLDSDFLNNWNVLLTDVWDISVVWYKYGAVHNPEREIKKQLNKSSEKWNKILTEAFYSEATPRERQKMLEGVIKIIKDILSPFPISASDVQFVSLTAKEKMINCYSLATGMIISIKFSKRTKNNDTNKLRASH